MERLRWEFDWRTKGYEVLAKAARDVALPQWFLDEPVADESVRFYVDAFWQLSTERAVGMVLGAIPHSKVLAEGARRGLSPAMMGVFSAVIRTLDDAYLEWALKRQSAKGAS